MSNVSRSESRRMYSWWWDSHISPKNSKWLQENLTDMDVKIKAMIKLIEEDADSFARRAEMYYKKRPELMKLVEEFYRAYRALAERYDHANGVLRQAQRTMAEAFPNQIPLVLSDESPNGSLNSVESHTPDLDDLSKDPFGISSHFHSITRHLAFSDEIDIVMPKKELKHLNDLFELKNDVSFATTPEVRARKGLKFEDLAEKEDSETEIRCLKDKINELLEENQNLKNRLALESEHAENAENDVQRLKVQCSELEAEKQASDLQSKVFLTMIADHHSEISCLRNNLAEFSMFREQCLRSERENESLHLELKKLREVAEYRAIVLNLKEENIMELKILIKGLDEKCVDNEAAFNRTAKLHVESQQEVKILTLSAQAYEEKIRDKDHRILCLTDELKILGEEITCLREENLSSALSTKNLRTEVFSLKQAKQTLEREVENFIKEKEDVLLELCTLEVEKNYFQQDKQYLEKQLEVVNSKAENLLMEVKELQEGTEKMKDTCERYEDEKVGLLQRLEFLQSIAEKNSAMENSLFDFNVEKDRLNARIKSLAESHKSLLAEISVSSSEKATLATQVDFLAENMDKLLEKNTSLEKSVSDVNAELKKLRLKNQSLFHEKSVLICENETLTSKVENLGWRLETLERRCTTIEAKIFNLEEQKSSMHCQLQELEELLMQKNKHHEALILSSNIERASFESQIDLYQKTALFMEWKFLEEHEKHLGTDIEIFIMRRSLLDLKQRSSCLKTEFQRHIEESKKVKEVISKLRKDESASNKMIASLSESNNRLWVMINSLIKVLNVNSEVEFPYSVNDEHILQIVLDKLQDFLNFVSLREDDNNLLQIEKSVILTILKTLKLEFENIRSEKYFIEQEIATRYDELIELKGENHDLAVVNEQLKRDMEECNNREEELRSEIGMLCGQYSQLAEGKELLSKMILDLKQENAAMKEHNDSIVSEAVALELVCVVLKNLNMDRTSELIQSNGDRRYLLGKITELDCHINLLMKKLESSQAENLIFGQFVVHLDEYKRQVKKLEEDLDLERNVHEQQNRQIENQRYLLEQKEQALIKVNQELRESKCLSHREIFNLTKKNEFLSLKVDHLCMNLGKVEENIDDCIKIALAKDCLYLLFQSAYLEGTMEMKTLRGHVDYLNREMNEKLQLLCSENDNIKESVTGLVDFQLRLKDLERDMTSIQSLCAQLNLDNESRNALLAEKEIELSHVKQKSEEVNHFLEREISMLVVKNKLLSENICELQEDLESVEMSNSSVFGEATMFKLLHLIAERANVERLSELTLLTKDYNDLCDLSASLDQKVRDMDDKILGIELENSQLQEMIISLEENKESIGWALQVSEAKISTLVEEKKSLLSDINMSKANEKALEMVNDEILKESITSDLLHLLFKCFSIERSSGLKFLSDHLRGLHASKKEVDEEMKTLQEENVDIKEAILCLEDHKTHLSSLEEDFKIATCTIECLKHQLDERNAVLIQKDRDLLEVHTKSCSTEDENAELRSRVQSLLLEINGNRLAHEKLEGNILVLTEGNASRNKKILHLHEINNSLEVKHDHLLSEIDTLRTKEGKLTAEVQKGIDIINFSEDETAKLLHDIQLSTVNSVFLEERLLEVIFTCESVQIASIFDREILSNEIISMKLLVDELWAKLSKLGGENEGLKADLNAYIPLIISLSQSIAKLELNIGLLLKLIAENSEENFRNNENGENIHELNNDYDSIGNNGGIAKLEHLLSKIEALQQVMATTCSVFEQKRVCSKTKYGQQMKDIQLDQTSSSSLRRKKVGLYGSNRMRGSKTDDQMLELWETAEMDCSEQRRKALSIASEQDITEFHEIEAAEEERSEYPSSELVPEKELCVDKPELMPKKAIELRQKWKKRVMERLGADFQRISVLQIGIQELKKMMENNKYKHASGYKYDSLRARLMEAEGAIFQLSDINAKLTLKVEEYRKSLGGSKGESREMGRTGKRQISEQARRGSEKIGELELELQKIHYDVLKLREEHQSRVRASSDGSNLLLRDFIYTSKHRRRLCGCMRPKTKDD